MAIIIPEPYKSAVAAMVNMGSADRQALLLAIDSAPQAPSLQSLESHLQAETSISRATIRATISMAFSLLEAAEGSDEAYIKELAEGVANAAAHENLGGLGKHDASAVATLADFLRELFEREAVLGITGKVTSLLYDHAKVYLDSRILTDFRPLFDDTKEPTTLRAGMFVHTLRLRLMSPGDKNSALYVAFDRGDLISLRGIIDRSIAKEHLLRQQLAPLEIPWVDPEE